MKATKGKNSIVGVLSLARDLRRATDSLSVAMETNGKGFHGFIVELPGAFVRGGTEQEAVSKVHWEARSYLKWLGQKRISFPKPRIVQTHRCTLMVEDADCEILLVDDKRPMSEQEFRSLVELASFSGLTFNALFDSVRLKDWVDEARIRTTFYGQNKKTIREIFEHVNQTQYYYLSRTGLSLREDEADPFTKVRANILDEVGFLFRENGNSKTYAIDSEEWTLKKILRRFIWHDRIHGKAIVRILEKQRQLGFIQRYQDPFKFEMRPDESATTYPPGSPLK